MKMYRFNVRVIHDEIWDVPADSLADAVEKVKTLDASVETDDTGGEVVDWKIVGKGKVLSDD